MEFLDVIAEKFGKGWSARLSFLGFETMSGPDRVAVSRS
jgi:hypothetical protein